MIFLGPKPSLEFWASHRTPNHSAQSNRQGKNAGTFRPEPTRKNPQPGKRPTIAEIKKLGLPQGISSSGPLEVVVADDNSRSNAQGLITIPFLNPPRGSFYQLDDNYSICSPEACFLLEARMVNRTELIELGFMLCGSYAYMSDGTTGYNLEPLTSVSGLSRYIEKATGAHCSRIASKAVSYVIDGSASPMETKAAIVLSLPSRMGGYGLPKPQMNCRIEIPPSYRNRYQSSYFRCDLFWNFGTEENPCYVALEYDSSTYHTNEERIARDAMRRNALIDLGLIVFGLTAKQIHESKEWDRLAEQIHSVKGRRTHAPSERTRKARKDLLKDLGLA